MEATLLSFAHGRSFIVLCCLYVKRGEGVGYCTDSTFYVITLLRTRSWEVVVPCCVQERIKAGGVYRLLYVYIPPFSYPTLPGINMVPGSPFHS